IRLVNQIADPRRRSNQVEVVLALQSLLNNFHVQQTQKPAAEAEAQRHRTFRLKEKRRVVELQLLERLAQLRVFVRVHRVEAGKHHGLDLFKAGQRLDGE